MVKRSVGVCCGFIATLYVAQINPNSNFINGVQVVSAEESCTTEEECDEQIDAAQRRISAARSKRDETSNILSGVEADWSEVIARIETTEVAITILENQVEETLASIENHKDELVQLDEEVLDLQHIIGYRLRIAQRMNNSNEILEFITESETIVDFIRRVRIINHLSKSDAELMEELNTLIERQQITLTTLQDEQADLTAKNQQLAIEKATLATNQKNLENRMASLDEEIKSSERIIIDEEEELRMIEAHKEVLARVEIPKVVTMDSSNDSNSINSDIGTINDNDTNNNRSSNENENNNNRTSNDSGTSNNNTNSNGGENNTPPTNSIFTRPMSSGIVTCNWMCYPNHNGIDISHSNTHAPILAAATGVVSQVRDSGNSGYGIYVVIDHDIDGERYGTLYAHLRYTPMVSEGETVRQGQQIGVMGNTGTSTGPHLHFEIHPGGWGPGRQVDPRTYIDFPAQGSSF